MTQSNVLITGASSGIGAACMDYLHQKGWRVFAGVRKEADAQSIRETYAERVTPLILDVTNEDHIAAAFETIQAEVGENGLHGLINSAGISVVAPLEYVPEARLRQGIEINLTATIRVTQVFLPLLRKGTGRIINMGSPSGRFASPFFGVYAASKFGLRAFSDALRVELRRWGLHVVLMEPGAVATAIWQKGGDETKSLRESLPEEAIERYGRSLKKVGGYTRYAAKNAIPVEDVAEKVHAALTVDRPRAYYMMGRDARFLTFLGWLPAWLRDRRTAKLFV